VAPAQKRTFSAGGHGFDRWALRGGCAWFCTLALIAGCSDRHPAGASKEETGTAKAIDNDCAATPGAVLYYRHPMNPAVTSPTPAKDQMGMDYIPVYASEMTGKELSLSDAVVQKLGVRTVAVTEGPLATETRAVGTVQFDATSIRDISLKSEGWVERLGASAPGEIIERGQLLFELYSPRLETAEQEYLNALQFSDAERIALSEQRLRDLGFESSTINTLRDTRKLVRRIPFHASTRSVVVELRARAGSYAPIGEVVMRLAAIDPVWVIIDIPQSAPAIAPGDVAEIHLPNGESGSVEGRVDNVYSMVDSASRTRQARLVVANPGRLLVPHMSVSAIVRSQSGGQSLHVPVSAVIRDGKGDRVVVALDQGRFAVRAVQLGKESAGEVIVLGGLAKGDRVVESALFLIDSEANLHAALARLDAGSACKSMVPQQQPQSH